MGHEEEVRKNVAENRARVFGEMAAALVNIMLPGEKVEVTVPIGGQIITPGNGGRGVVEITFFRAVHKFTVSGR